MHCAAPENWKAYMFVYLVDCTYAEILFWQLEVLVKQMKLKSLNIWKSNFWKLWGKWKYANEMDLTCFFTFSIISVSSSFFWMNFCWPEGKSATFFFKLCCFSFYSNFSPFISSGKIFDLLSGLFWISRR